MMNFAHVLVPGEMGVVTILNKKKKQKKYLPMFLDIVVMSQAQRLVRASINITVIEIWYPNPSLQMPTSCENPAELWPLGCKLLLGFAPCLAQWLGVPASAVGWAFQEAKQKSHPIQRIAWWEKAPIEFHIAQSISQASLLFLASGHSNRGGSV